jgi:hypothetical protein
VFPHRHPDHFIPIVLGRWSRNSVVRFLEACRCLVTFECLHAFLIPLAPILQVCRQAPLDDRLGPLDAQRHLHRRSRISTQVLAIAFAIAIAARRCQVVHSQTAHAPESVQVFRHPYTAVTAHASARCLSVIVFAPSCLLFLSADHPSWR